MKPPGILIIDGYIDEPSTLGVPPYISPCVRYIYGAAITALKDSGYTGTNFSIDYLTIQQVRELGLRGMGKKRSRHDDADRNYPAPHGMILPDHDILILVNNTPVPGNYLAGRPASRRELDFIAERSLKSGSMVIAWKTPVGPGVEGQGDNSNRRGGYGSRGHGDEGHSIRGNGDEGCRGKGYGDEGCGGKGYGGRRCGDQRHGVDGEIINLQRDPDAFLHDILSGLEPSDRFRTDEEWDLWAQAGAGLLKQHPDFPGKLMCEVDTLKGCIRYITGGCTFCTEPLEHYRERSLDSLLREIKALVREGGRNIRLGGSCIFSYLAAGIGETEFPEPSPERLEKLFRGIRNVLPPRGVFHTDNANAGIIAAHPEKSEEVIKTIVKYTSPGNSLSLGLESADPEVIRLNRLNADPEQVREAVRLINRYGKYPGDNGMPALLPGINLLYGLPGETDETFRLNHEFLKGMREEGLLFRRINIRQLSPVRIKGLPKNRRFRCWKEKIRNEIDVPNLKDVVPSGTVLTGVSIETHDGGNSFGRQAGTYPILVGIPYHVETGEMHDVRIIQHGPRSVTGITVPFDIDHASIRALASLPGVGKKRAARIIRSRPIGSLDDLVQCLGDRNIAEAVYEFL